MKTLNTILTPHAATPLVFDLDTAIDQAVQNGKRDAQKLKWQQEDNEKRKAEARTLYASIDHTDTYRAHILHIHCQCGQNSSIFQGFSQMRITLDNCGKRLREARTAIAYTPAEYSLEERTDTATHCAHCILAQFA